MTLASNHPNCDEPCTICDKIRQDFETWAISIGFSEHDFSDCNELIEYENPFLQCAWLGYQAGLKHE